MAVRTILLTLFAVALLLAAGCSPQRPPVAPAQVDQRPSSATPTPAATETLSPSNIPSLPAAGSWAAEVTNPWFPQIPGTTRVFHGVTDGEVTIDTFVVAKDKKTILGVRTTVVRDTMRTKGGKLLEDAEDWYAQDMDGTVWYFGGITRSYKEDGKSVESTEAWQAGVDGAIAGIFMRPRPAIGYRQYQDYYKGQAEDQFAVVSIDATVSVPYGSFSGALLTEESTLLEPGVVTEKYYVRGVGQVYEVDAKGGNDFNKLASVKK
jgi:hypothetical protein